MGVSGASVGLGAGGIVRHQCDPWMTQGFCLGYFLPYNRNCSLTVTITVSTIIGINTITTITSSILYCHYHYCYSY